MGKPFEKIQQRFVRCFLAGVFALLPVIITVAVVVWVTDFLNRFIGPETFIGGQLSKLGLQIADESAETLSFTSYAIGWIIVLAAVFCLGIVIEMGARNRIKKLVDAILSRVPLVGKIYSSSRQVVDMLDKTDDQNLQGMKPVFCYFGQQNPTVFLALLVSPKRFRLNEIDYCIVIVPTAPIPFGGGLLFVPAPCVKDAPLSVDALMSIYVSMGATAGQFLTESPAATEEIDPAGRG
jgi:uncharacterized membrane protein